MGENTVHTRSFYGIFRIALAAIGLISLVGRFIWAVGTGARLDNLFAYLTIQSNILFVLVTAVAAISAFRGPRDAQWLTTVRTVVLTLTCTSGTVFVILVYEANAMGTPMDVPWSDVVLHYVLPVLALVEWLKAPGRGRSQWRAIPTTLGFVGGWGIVTLIRGPIVGWYPYFFLDPELVGGIGEMAMFCGIALAIFSSIGAGAIGLTVLNVSAFGGAVTSFVARLNGASARVGAGAATAVASAATVVASATAPASAGRPVISLADFRGSPRSPSPTALAA
jgi:hypothetical protein